MQSIQWDSVFFFHIHNANLISYGIWKIEATYADTFGTTATAEFEVKEYGKTTVSDVMLTIRVHEI